MSADRVHGAFAFAGSPCACHNRPGTHCCDSGLHDVAKQNELTSLINAWQQGDEGALDTLLPHVYDELHRLARRQMRGESQAHTLQATALVNEAFMRLANIRLDYQDRNHFLAMAAQTMRRVLVDHARQKKSAKRGGNARKLTLDEQIVAGETERPDLIELDMALTKLADVDAGLANAVELVFFGGLTYAEAASALGVSKTRIFNDLTLAKAWLKIEMSNGTGDP